MKNIADVLDYLRKRREQCESRLQFYRDTGMPALGELPLREVEQIIAHIEESIASPERAVEEPKDG